MRVLRERAEALSGECMGDVSDLGVGYRLVHLLGVLLGVGLFLGLGFGHVNLFGFGVEDDEVLGVVALAVDPAGALGVDRRLFVGAFDDFDAILDEAGAFIEAGGADDAEVLFFVLGAEELAELLVVGAGFGEACLEAFFGHTFLVLPNRFLFGDLFYGFFNFPRDAECSSLDEDGFNHLVGPEHLLRLVVVGEELLGGEVGEFLAVVVGDGEFEVTFDLEGEVCLELSFSFFGGEGSGLYRADESRVVLLVSDEGDVVATGVAEGVNLFHNFLNFDW